MECLLSMLGIRLHNCLWERVTQGRNHLHGGTLMTWFAMSAVAVAILMIIVSFITQDRLVGRALRFIGVAGVVMNIPRMLGLGPNLWTLGLFIVCASVAAVPLYQLLHREWSSKRGRGISRPI